MVQTKTPPLSSCATFFFCLSSKPAGMKAKSGATQLIVRKRKARLPLRNMTQQAPTKTHVWVQDDARKESGQAFGSRGVRLLSAVFDMLFKSEYQYPAGLHLSAKADRTRMHNWLRSWPYSRLHNWQFRNFPTYSGRLSERGFRRSIRNPYDESLPSETWPTHCLLSGQMLVIFCFCACICFQKRYLR